MPPMTRKLKTHQRRLDGVEDFLSTAFSPVMPSTEYVRQLGERLSNYPKPLAGPVRSGSHWWQFTLLALLSVLGGGLVVAIMMRNFITLIAAVRVIHQLRRESHTKMVVGY